MHFGLYLEKKGVISARQLVDALRAQLAALPPVGQLALEEGMLTARDIFEILRAQSRSPSEHFGELAIEMGLLNRGDLTRLLMIQADRKRPIAEILVDQGVLSRPQLAGELAAYRRGLLGPRPAIARTKIPIARRRAPVCSTVQDAAAR